MRIKPDAEQCSNCRDWKKCSKKSGIERWNVLKCWYPSEDEVKVQTKKSNHRSIIEPKKFCFLGGFKHRGNGHK